MSRTGKELLGCSGMGPYLTLVLLLSLISLPILQAENTIGGLQREWSVPNEPSERSFGIKPESGGSGTREDPFLISDTTSLQGIEQNLSAYYILTQNIDASETVFWNDEKGFEPIGSKEAPFLGSLDGGGFAISGLNINRTYEDLVAIFARTLPSSTISNLTIVNSTVKGRDFTGTLIGQNYGTIMNVTILDGIVEGRNDTGGLAGYSIGFINKNSYNGTVKGYQIVGGLVGKNDFTVSSCNTTIMINGAITVGGLIGNNNHNVINCSAAGYVKGNAFIGGAFGSNSGNINVKIIDTEFRGSVHGEKEVGGFIGCNYGIIFNSSNKGDVSCPTYHGSIFPYYNIGGFVGNNFVEIQNSHSKVNIFGSANFIGGFVGYNYYGRIKKCSASVDLNSPNCVSIGSFAGYNGGTSGLIEECLTSGMVNGTKIIGGFIGTNYATIKNSYSMTNSNVTIDTGGGFCGKNEGYFGKIINSYSMGKIYGNNTVGGFVGLNNCQIINCFFNKEITGLDQSDGDGSMSTAPLSSKEALFVISSSKFDWDFSTIWGQAPGQTYPFLRWENNNPPIMEDFELPELIEDHPFSIDLKATDIDLKDIVPFWYLTSNAKWLKIEKETGMLYGTPLGNDCTNIWMNVSVTDGRGGWDHLNKTVSVTPINDAPVILTEPITSVHEDTQYFIEFEGFDEDEDELTWTCWTDADWLIFKTYKDLMFIPYNTARLFGRPDNGDVGIWSVKVSLSDNNGSVVHSQFNVEVLQVNDRPKILNDCPIMIDEGDFSFQYMASDEENDPLVWYLNTDASWLKIDNIAGRLSGTTTDDDLGEYSVNVSVSDGNGGRDHRQFRLTVNNVNDDPCIYSVPDDKAVEDHLYEFHFQALDTDPTMDMLEWEIEPLGSWFTIDASTGWMKGIPENDDVGTNSVRVVVNDGKGGTHQISFIIDVENANDPPYWIETPKMVLVYEGENVVLHAAAGDVDAGDRLSYGIGSNPMIDISIDEVTGTITWERSVLGSYNIEITATDGQVTIKSSFWLEVQKNNMTIINSKPVIVQVPDQRAWVGEWFLQVIMGHDPDTTETSLLTFSIVKGPNGSVISNDGIFSWTPVKEDIGSHLVTVALNDTIDQTTMSFFIEVVLRKEVKDPPWVLFGSIALIIILVPLLAILFMVLHGKWVQKRKKDDMSFYAPFYIKRYEGIAEKRPPLPPKEDGRSIMQGTKGKGP
ncbi:MAG: putative Ig domain-containing protein [Candidatus Thermoplasmatota archaeon]|nr:putative Ig domain-containing protein [Candidatus Thermoplasmatota archaeon]